MKCFLFKLSICFSRLICRLVYCINIFFIPFNEHWIFKQLNPVGWPQPISFNWVQIIAFKWDHSTHLLNCLFSLCAKLGFTTNAFNNTAVLLLLLYCTLGNIIYFGRSSNKPCCQQFVNFGNSNMGSWVLRQKLLSFYEYVCHHPRLNTIYLPSNL